MYAKTKALISFAVTAKLICVFVFAYAKTGFLITRLKFLFLPGLDGVCGDVGQGGQYVATSRTLKIKYVATSKDEYYRPHTMKLIATAFHEGKNNTVDNSE